MPAIERETANDDNSGASHLSAVPDAMRMTLARSPILLLLLGCLAACDESPDRTVALDEAARAELETRIDVLGTHVEAAESLRAIKRLQWAYGHYSEFGLWHDFADLLPTAGSDTTHRAISIARASARSFSTKSVRVGSG
jgi:hypothetical protein